MGRTKDLQPRFGPGYLSTGLGPLQVARAKYRFALDGGAVATITPKINATIPDNAVLVAAFINSTVAVTSSAGANVSVGLSAGSTGVAALLAATAKASLSLDALIVGVPTPAVPVKLTAAATITCTVDTTELTAGEIEVTVYYFVASA